MSREGREGVLLGRCILRCVARSGFVMSQGVGESLAMKAVFLR